MIAVVDTGGANIGCILYSLERMGLPAILTSEQSVIMKSDKVILPGVSSANYVMKNLEDKNLVDLIKELTVPTLGICVGHQILFDESEENSTKCLGVIAGKVTKFVPAPGMPVPQMGWNQLVVEMDHPLLHGISSGEFVFYANSYYAPVCQETIARGSYCVEFSAVVQKENFYGVQFHPEKSQKVGEVILKNFGAL